MKFYSKIHIRFLDLVIFGVAAALVMGTSLLVLNRQSGTRYVQMTGETGEWIAPLNKDAEYQIPGPLGITYMHIHNGTAAIVDSPCKNKLCILAGAISEPNQWVACLPNKVFVRITSKGSDGAGDTGGVDAGAY